MKNGKILTAGVCALLLLTMSGCRQKITSPAETEANAVTSENVFETVSMTATTALPESESSPAAGIDVDAPAPTERAEPPATVPHATAAPTKPKPADPIPTPPTSTEHQHSWSEWKQMTSPTCGKPGEEIRVCMGCDAEEIHSIAATGEHIWAESAPTCTQGGVKTCTGCDAKETLPALGHEWIHHEEKGHWQTLVTCYCGAQFYSVTEWSAHATASAALEYLNAHAGYEAHEIWMIDKPAQDVCARCGMVR